MNKAHDVNCPSCNRTFAFSDDDYEWFTVSGLEWHCPNCGTKRYFTEGNMGRLRGRFETLRANKSFYEKRYRELRLENDHLQAQLRGLRGYITRLKG